jgi:ribonuclease R
VPKSSSKTGLPSKQDIADFLRRQVGKVGKRDIAKAFGLKGEARIALKQLLRDMESDNSIAKSGKTLHPAEALPPIFAADIISRDSEGHLIAEPADWDAVKGPPPQLIILTPRKLKTGEPIPGLRDRVLVRISAAEEENTFHARVIKVLPKEKAFILGVVRKNPDGSGRLVAVDKKSRTLDYILSAPDLNGVEEGDLVSASVLKTNRFGAQQAKIREKLGALASEKAISLIAIHSHLIPHVFTPAILLEADKAAKINFGPREDWRTMPFITIDPADAKDHDDAVHAMPDPHPDNQGGHILTVAIADVTAYVQPHTLLDKEALERGNSVYFPDRVVPMLPERISNDVCSLRPLEDRPALAVRMIITQEGVKKSHSFHRIVMRSHAKLSYQQAQNAIDGIPDDTTKPLLNSVLKPLWAAYALLCMARDARGPLALDLPERKILLDAEGRVGKVLVPERLDAHRLIEECMILANVAAAETLEKAGSLLLYRAHNEPSVEKMRNLSEVLASISINLPKQGALRPAQFNRILKAVEGSTHQAFVNEIVLRSQAQAEYTADNYGHFGLNLRRYAHFTSPIRRYADLIVHRALIASLKLGKDGLPASTTHADMVEIATQISAAERRAMAAERETVDRLIAHHLSDQIGTTFQGRIAGVTRSGLFVKLDHTGADGFVPAATIGADYYAYDEARHSLRGERTGETYRLGDRVDVKLVEAAPIAGALRFELLSEGRVEKSVKGNGKKRGSRQGARHRALKSRKKA